MSAAINPTPWLMLFASSSPLDCVHSGKERNSSATLITAASWKTQRWILQRRNVEHAPRYDKARMSKHETMKSSNDERSATQYKSSSDHEKGCDAKSRVFSFGFRYSFVIRASSFLPCLLRNAFGVGR